MSRMLSVFNTSSEEMGNICDRRAFLAASSSLAFLKSSKFQKYIREHNILQLQLLWLRSLRLLRLQFDTYATYFTMNLAGNTPYNRLCGYVAIGDVSFERLT